MEGCFYDVFDVCSEFCMSILMFNVVVNVLFHDSILVPFWKVQQNSGSEFYAFSFCSESSICEW